MGRKWAFQEKKKFTAGFVSWCESFALQDKLLRLLFTFLAPTKIFELSIFSTEESNYRERDKFLRGEKKIKGTEYSLENASK